MEMIDLLQMTHDTGASDLILVAGTAPTLRLEGKIKITDLPVLTPQEAERLIFSILTEEQMANYKQHHELDLSYSLSAMARFRINVHSQRGSIAAALRRIPFKIPTPEELGLPPKIIKEFCHLRSGLMLVTGQSGSGKTTTLASMINIINSERASHIITIEDPIEYLHKHNKSIVEQREVYKDSPSFASALFHVLRQNPDIILVGEMRDLETIATAITAAETGQLVFATLHTINAAETINRIIDLFPSREHLQIRSQLAAVVRGVISQRLLPRADGKGLVLACEVMVGIPAIQNLIREAKTYQMPTVIETNAKYGMHSMDQDLLRLYRSKRIDKEELLFNIENKERDEIKDLMDEGLFGSIVDRRK